MDACSTKELSSKEVISTCDGRRLGYICDFRIDVSCGKIIAIVVPKSGAWLRFGKDSVIVIPWERICRIGEDAILVDIPAEELCDACSLERRGRFFR